MPLRPSPSRSSMHAGVLPPVLSKGWKKAPKRGGDARWSRRQDRGFPAQDRMRAAPPVRRDRGIALETIRGALRRRPFWLSYSFRAPGERFGARPRRLFRRVLQHVQLLEGVQGILLFRACAPRIWRCVRARPRGRLGRLLPLDGLGRFRPLRLGGLCVALLLFRFRLGLISLFFRLLHGLPGGNVGDRALELFFRALACKACVCIGLSHGSGWLWFFPHGPFRS